MKNIKTKSLITSLICVVVAAVLVLTIGYTFNQSEQEQASAAAIITGFTSKDGILYDTSNNIISTDDDNYDLVNGKYHMNTTGIAAKYPSGEYSVEYISTAAALKTFIEKCSSSSYATTVGVLTGDIDYNMPSLGMTSSSAAFFGILDGNAYDITMTAAAGGSTLSYNTNYKTTAGNAAPGSLTGYYYSGMICAVNEGKIINSNFIWESMLDVTVNLNSSNSTLASTDSYSTYYLTVAGLICGLNYNGTISNCQVTLNGAFAIGHRSTGNKNTDLCYNSCVAGGVVGLVGGNSLLERTTLNNNGGVLSLADGSTDNIYTKKASSIAGGLVGVLKPDDSTAQIKNCSITGTGIVRGMCGGGATDTNRNNDGTYGYAGGAIGATVVLGDDGDDDTNEKNQLYTGSAVSGQVSGIVSSWTGVRENIWGAGSSKEEKTIAGCLFDCVGSNISNCVILYDYLSLVATNSNSLGRGYTTLDSNAKIGYGKWTEIYATNSDGEISVSYDYSRANSPIRVEAVANGFFAEGNYTGAGTIKDASTTGTKFLLKDTVKNAGKFIWSCTYCEQERDVISGYALDASSDLVGAQIFFVSAQRKGAVRYTFGEKATLSYDNTNPASVTDNYITDFSKYYNGQVINVPNVVLTRSNLETAVVNTNAYTFSTKYTVLNGYDTTNYSYDVTDNTLLDLPGLYSFSAKKDVTFSDSTVKSFAYYDESAHVLADYNSANIYEYAIYSGTSEHFTSTSLTSSTQWATEDTLTIGYLNTAGLINYYSYSVGNGAQGQKVAMPTTATTAVNVSTTGKYVYNFKAYVVNPYAAATATDEELYLIVGQTSVNSYVDTVAPEIKNIKYYEYDATAEDNGYLGFELTTIDLEDWVTSNIWVIYTVTDNNLSGLASGAGHTSSTEVNKTRWECKLLLNGTTSSQQVTYVDEVGNIARKTFSANIDTTTTALEDVVALNYSEYLVYYARYGYCPTEVVLTFTPVFGASGAYLQYSYEQDSNDEDIWVDYTGTLTANTPNTFKIDFELINQTFKMRLISTEGIFATAYANEDGYVTNGLSDVTASRNWTIKIVIAYLGISLDNIFYNGNSLASTSNINGLFAKTYDGTDSTTKSFDVNVYSEGTTKISGTSIVYTDMYSYNAPQIEEDCLKLNVTYSAKDAGSRTVTLTVSSIGDYLNKYLVFFTDTVLTTTEAFVEEDDFYNDITATIAPANLTVNMSDYTSQFKTQYTYGEAIPSTITVNGVGDEKLTMAIDSDAKLTYEDEVITAYPAADTYSVTAHLATASDNYHITVNPMNTTIVAKPVAVATKLDNVSNYTTSITFDGMPHNITGTFNDVFAASKEATINYFTDSTCATPLTFEESVTGVIPVGVYYAKITIEDSNYIVSNSTTVIRFSIIKGFLELNLTEQSAEFKGTKIDYSIVTAKTISTDYYKQEDFTMTYYPVNNGVADFTSPVTSVMLVGKYLVTISLAGNGAFYDTDYDDTYLTITKAATTITAEEISIPYNAEGSYKYDMLAGNLSITGGASKTSVVKVNTPEAEEGEEVVNTLDYYDYSSGTSNIVNALTAGILELQYYDSTTRRYVPVTEVNGVYTNVGAYDYKIVFAGDDCFEGQSFIVSLTITPSNMEGIEFKGKTVFFGDTGSPYSIAVSGTGLQAYLDLGAEISYSYDGEIRVMDGTTQNFSFSEVGNYLITAKVSLDNYVSYTAMATLIISKTAMTGIDPVEVEEEYNGSYFYALFTSDKLAKDTNGNIIMEKADGTRITAMTSGTTCYVYYGEENTKVLVTYGTGAYARNASADTYEGKITFTSDAYADSSIDTRITINKKTVTVDFSMIQEYASRINSSTDITGLHSTFTNINGQTVSCTYEYYKKNTNEKVALNSDGTLAPGAYDIKIVFNDGNYTTTQKASITIAEAGATIPGANSGSGIDFMALLKQYGLYIGIGAGALVIIIIVIAVIAGKKNKKKKHKRNRKGGGKPNKGPGGGKPTRRPEMAPKKDNKDKIKDVTSKDKATF